MHALTGKIEKKRKEKKRRLSIHLGMTQRAGNLVMTQKARNNPNC
jgi:hypothetical protein